MDRFPDRTLAFSLPRIHEAPEGFEIPFAVSDEDLIRFYCALRMAFPRAVLVLSTREQADFRNTLAKICITQMSAGSSTAPGGYGPRNPQAVGEQFPCPTTARRPKWLPGWSEKGLTSLWTAGAKSGRDLHPDENRIPTTAQHTKATKNHCPRLSFSPYINHARMDETTIIVPKTAETMATGPPATASA